jgi:restriction endonuclease S subunit
MEGSLPDNWELRTIEDVCVSPQYGWTTSGIAEGSLHLLRTTDITSGKIDWSTVPFCADEPPDKEKYLLHDGDIVISRAGSVGYSQLIKNPNPAVFASYLIRFRPLINEKYVAFFLQSPAYWQAISERKLGIAIPNVNASKLKQIKIPVAPLQEQKRIVLKIEELFTQLDAGMVALHRTHAGLERYRASVLKAAVQGRLVQQGTNDESATVLLQKLGERRKQRILDERKQSLRLYVDLHIERAGIDSTPSDVFKDFLIEVVLENIDEHAAQAVINEYFGSVHSATDSTTQTREFISWLANASGALRHLGYESKVLNTNLSAWQKYGEENSSKQKHSRSIGIKMGAGDSIVSGFGKWLEVEGLPLKSIDSFRKKYLDEPVETKWKKEIAQLRRPDVKSLPTLPNGWQWVRAEEICEFITKGTTPKGEKMFSGSGEIPYIKVYNLTFDGTLDFSVNPTFINEDTHTDELARSKVLPGDVLMNIVGPPLGKVSIVPDIFPEWNMNQAIARFRPLDVCNRRYLSLALRTDSVLSWAVKRAKATAGQFNLTLEICRDLPIPLPPLAEQSRIVAEVERRLSVAGNIGATLNTNVVRAARLRQSILKLAFEGKLMAQNPQDEPASRLLERILQDKKDESERPAKPRLIQTERKSRSRKQIPLPLPSSETLKLHEVLSISGRVLTPSELFVLANCKPDDVSRFYEELRREIYDLKRIIELRPDRTKEGTLEARR